MSHTNLFVSNLQLRLAIEQCNAGNFRRPSRAIHPPSPADIETPSPSDDAKDELASLDSALDTEAETTDDESQRLN